MQVIVCARARVLTLVRIRVMFTCALYFYHLRYWPVTDIRIFFECQRNMRRGKKELGEVLGVEKPSLSQASSAETNDVANEDALLVTPNMNPCKNDTTTNDLLCHGPVGSLNRGNHGRV